MRSIRFNVLAALVALASMTLSLPAQFTCNSAESRMYQGYEGNQAYRSKPSLQFFHEPLAWEVLDHTLILQGFLEGGYESYSFESDDIDSVEEAFYGGIVDLRLQRRARSGWSYGLEGRLFAPNFDDSEDYEGLYQFYLEGIWGRFSYGNSVPRDLLVLDALSSSVGASDLLFLEGFAPKLESAFRYQARYSSLLVDASLNDDADNWVVSLLHRSPYSSWKLGRSLTYSGDDLTGRHSLALGLQALYSSWSYSGGIRWDRFDEDDSVAQISDRYSLNLGLGNKWGRHSISLGGYYGQQEQGVGTRDYWSGSLGYSCDFARGLRWNLGWSYFNGGELSLLALPDTEGHLLRSSLSYRF